jgi:hypothetical protein
VLCVFSKRRFNILYGELAEANIKVILCSCLTGKLFYWQPKAQPATTILALNESIQRCQRKRTVVYIILH